MRVAVVGAGIAGSAAAYHLVGRGHEVTVFEQFEVGHDRGSSHGHSRIVRKAYPDPFYTEIMLEGYPMWVELERECPERLLFETGLLVFGAESSGDMRGMVDGLRSLGVTHEVVDPEDARRWMPSLRLEPDEIAVLTPEAGWVHAERSVRHLLETAVGRGAELRHERVDSLEALEARFDAVVLCAGAWSRRFLDLPVEVSLQTFAYVEARQDGPVWIEDGPSFLYGFPSEPGTSWFKIGMHRRGPPHDPDATDRLPDPVALEGIREVAERRFGVRQPRLVEAKGCLYTNTQNEDFLLGRASEKTVFASACSGHGFKFGPWVGRTLADFVEGKFGPERYSRLACRAARR